MNIDEYKAAVIALFKSGNATDEQWEEMASCILCASEGSDGTDAIDDVILKEPGPDYIEDIERDATPKGSLQ